MRPLACCHGRDTAAVSCFVWLVELWTLGALIILFALIFVGAILINVPIYTVQLSIKSQRQFQRQIFVNRAIVTGKTNHISH
jgi:hypothetical protein